jgi:hypothetical protein
MKVLSIIPIFLLFAQCDRHERVIRTYVLENGTGYVLKFDSYIDGKVRESYSLETNQERGFKYEDSIGRTAQPYKVLESDSIIVVFDNKKQQVYKRFDPKDRNIFDDAAYQVESKEVYRFTFTEEDYRLAKDL